MHHSKAAAIWSAASFCLGLALQVSPIQSDILGAVFYVIAAALAAVGVVRTPLIAHLRRRYGVTWMTLLLVASAGAVVGACVAVTLWVVIRPGPVVESNSVRLEWRREEPELKVAIVSETSRTLRDVWLDITDIRKLSPRGEFVEVPAFHGTGRFQEFQIGAGFSSDVYPDTPLVLRFLNAANPSVIGIWGVYSDEKLHWIPVPEAGVWRVTFKGGNGIVVKSPFLYFRWTPGTKPEPWIPER